MRPAVVTSESEASVQRVRSHFERTLGFAFSVGNRVQRLRNGKEIFPAMLRAIDEAKHRVEVLTFIYWTGDIAQRFADALAKKAREGVEVRALLDAFGSARMPGELVERMREAGVDVELFRPVRRRDMLRVTNRTHRKILVCDRQVAFTGGVGIAEEWEGDARHPGEWRETHFRFEGPVVDGLHAAFLDNWAEAKRFLVTDPSLDPPKALGSAAACVVRSTGGSAWNDMRLTTLALFAAAQKELLLATAYFVPDVEMLEAFEAARARGVSVVVILPGEHSDHRVCTLASGEELCRLADAGVKLHLYQRTMLHAKIVLVDGVAAFIGSPNLNQRSMKLDDEVGVLALDPPLVEALRDDFRADLTASEAFDAARWQDRGPFQTAVEALSRRLRSGL
ncbi:MAG: phospholipase D-like domain-containing protein [Planctomycetota bacterium]